MLITLCCDKGSPGVTTAALALATAWPEPTVVVEADPAGGDLGIRLHPGGSALPETPTVLSLTAAARTKVDGELLAGHVHRLNGGVSVVPGAVRREQMTKLDTHALASALCQVRGKTVVADIGQLDTHGSMFELAARSRAVVVVARPEMTSIVRLRERLTRLGADLASARGAPPLLFALLISNPRHGSGHIADLRALVAETPAKPFMAGFGFLAHDEGAVRLLDAGAEPSGRLARTQLLRTARHVAADLTSLIGADADAANPAASGRAQ